MCSQKRRTDLNLQDLIRLVVGSQASDWHRMDVHSEKENDHDYRAVFLPDPSISLCWGGGRRAFQEKWTDKFIGKEAETQHAEIFLNGSIVFQEVYVSVDSGKGILPMPTASDHTVPSTRLRFARLLHYLSGNGVDERRFDYGVQLSGIKETNDPWPDV
jgi:hypothetical protein